MQRIDHHFAIAVSVLLRPEHNVLHLWVVAFEKHVSCTQWYEHTVPVQRQNAMALYSKHGVPVTAICCVVEEHQIGYTVIGFVVLVFAEVTENFLVHPVEGRVGCLLGRKVDERLNLSLKTWSFIGQCEITSATFQPVNF